MTPANIATAADYADAMLTARRAKRVLVGLIFAILVIQITLFCLVHFRVLDTAPVSSLALVSTEAAPATQPATGSTSGTMARLGGDVLHYLLGLSVFLGVVLPIVLAVVVLLILMIMLVGRLIGVSAMTSAFIWCVVLAALLFPWQAFLNNAELTRTEFRVPGVLYTWEELVQWGRFETHSREAYLKWARFAGFPVAALIITLMVGAKSNRGLRMALGESELAVNVDETGPMMRT